MEYNCAWEEDTCTDGRIFMRAVCNCNCPGYMLCCDPSILEVYDYPTWRGIAPICTASCDSCGPVQSLCWWQSRCGDGDWCLTGNKYLCGRYKRKNSWPFLDKIVSCSDVECQNFPHQTKLTTRLELMKFVFMCMCIKFSVIFNNSVCHYLERPVSEEIIHAAR